MDIRSSVIDMLRVRHFLDIEMSQMCQLDIWSLKFRVCLGLGKWIWKSWAYRCHLEPWDCAWVCAEALGPCAVTVIGHWVVRFSSRNRREVSSGSGRWPKGAWCPRSQGRRPVGQVSVNSCARCHWRIKWGADEGVIIYSGSVEGLVILLSMALVEWQSWLGWIKRVGGDSLEMKS